MAIMMAPKSLQLHSEVGLESTMYIGRWIRMSQMPNAPCLLDPMLGGTCKHIRSLLKKELHRCAAPWHRQAFVHLHPCRNPSLKHARGKLHSSGWEEEERNAQRMCKARLLRPCARKTLLNCSNCSHNQAGLLDWCEREERNAQRMCKARIVFRAASTQLWESESSFCFPHRECNHWQPTVTSGRYTINEDCENWWYHVPASELRRAHSSICASVQNVAPSFRLWVFLLVVIQL